MKKILIFIFLYFLNFGFSFAETCKYKAKFDKCTKAIEDFIGKSYPEKILVSGSLKDFKEFPCIQDGSEARYYQIAMDENFKKIDEDMDKYLKSLYESKDFYFGKDKNYDYFDGISHIFLKRDEFKKLYDEACLKSLQETAVCMGNGKVKEISILGALDFISGAEKSGSCFLLAETKTNIFLEIAYNGLLLNKQQIGKDVIKLETQLERENYSKLLESMRINLSYIERLNSKWTSKTKHTLNSR